jgi:D-3-phosphoglycerate dehydrogenase
MNVELTSLDDIYKRSDIITVHVPLDASTKDLLRKETFAKCKDGVKIINCARGGIVNEDDLLEALNSGKVSGAAMDVFVKEPPDFSHPLLKHPKFVSTPHLGASTDEAQEKVAIQIAEQIIDLFKKKIVFGAVNAAAVEAAGKPELAPYIKLAESMGALQSQLLTSQVKSLRVNLFGDLLNNSVSLMTAAVLKGFLKNRIPEPVNYINAGYFAKEMGLQIEEVKSSDHPDYINLISVECTTAADKRKLDGVVFGNNEIRIVNIDEFHLELNPEGDMLFYTNLDRPGMLAKVGAILAENDINIAGLSLGRFGIGKEALTVINLDSGMEKEVLGKISSIDGVSKVFSVKI